MLPNLHNPMVSVPISLEVLRDAFSEMDDLLLTSRKVSKVSDLLEAGSDYVGFLT